jgi:lipoprotein-anchoring transpeptidase ErfK/SrfK
MYESLSGVEEIALIVPAVSLKRKIAVSLSGFILLGFVSQLALQGWFNGRLAPGVTIAHIEVGGLTLGQARQTLNEAETRHPLSFVVAGKRYQPSMAEIGAHYDTETVLKEAYRLGRDGVATHSQQVNLSLNPVVDSGRLASYLEPITHIGTAPVDARLEVRKGVLAVIADKPGFTINTSGLEKSLRDNLASLHSDEPVVTPEVLGASIQAVDLSDAQTQAQSLMTTVITLSDGTTTLPVTSSDIAGWLNFELNETTKKPATKIDPGKVTAYVNALAKRTDHHAIDRKVNNINGVETLQIEGKDGDAIDQAPIVAALSGFVVGVPVTIAVTRHPVAFKTTTTFLADISSGKYIEINLNQQHLWVWDNHRVVYDSPVTSGAVGAGFGTVTGTFQIYTKEVNRRLKGPGYDVPVKYWMPFHGGYGLHDAIWRKGKFGGQDYIRGGSHGCVNLPDATAEWLYNWSVVGTPVYIHK